MDWFALLGCGHLKEYNWSSFYSEVTLIPGFASSTEVKFIALDFIRSVILI